ncbi:MAG: tRNA (adenosine(37)-N6)-dimethylallyltransferase MiaA [Bergeyella sp.]|nr:tRNA (adenosine(37)-N6)-dimethylallyltransferase MiaA [Bergeyella sp.]
MKTVISIVGATSTGKTDLAIKLAQYLATEIISCDSRQFFQEMPIGTSAPTRSELLVVPHHFIGNLTVADRYSIGQYETDAMKKTEKLFQKHEVLILVGGSMMYEKALITGLNDLPEAMAENQETLHKIWRKEGIIGLQKLLQKLDPEYAQVVDLNNPRRLLRAIDVIWQTNQKYSVLISKLQKPRNFRTIRIGIEAPREIIYSRIDKRVNKMLEMGLVEEVKNLKHYENEVPLKTVGYSEIFGYFNGRYSLDFAISEIKKNTRRFAKRQLTWYRKETDIHWVSYDEAFGESLFLLHSLL